MTSVLLAATLASLVAITLMAAYRLAPRRLNCPECTGDTEPVQLPRLLRFAAPRLVKRWCPACGWEGIGRRGLAGSQGRFGPMSAGFRWGQERPPATPGFRFRLPRPPQPPPAHPSGFDWARHTRDEGLAGLRGPLFRWGQRGWRAAFRWKDPG
jgi:hypothetical protein